MAGKILEIHIRNTDCDITWDEIWGASCFLPVLAFSYFPAKNTFYLYKERIKVLFHRVKKAIFMLIFFLSFPTLKKKKERQGVWDSKR